MKFTLLTLLALAALATANPVLQDRHHDDWRWERECPKKTVTKTACVTKAKLTTTTTRTKQVVSTTTKHWCKWDWHHHKTVVTKTSTITKAYTKSSASTITSVSTATLPAVTHTTIETSTPDAVTVYATITSTPEAVTVISTEAAPAVTVTVIQTVTPDATTITQTSTVTETTSEPTAEPTTTSEPPAPTCTKSVSAIQNGNMETANPPVWSSIVLEGTAFPGVASGPFSSSSSAHSGTFSFRTLGYGSVPDRVSTLEVYQPGDFCPGFTYEASFWMRKLYAAHVCSVKFLVGGKQIGGEVVLGTDYKQIGPLAFVPEGESDRVSIVSRCEDNPMGSTRITFIDDVVVGRVAAEESQ